MGESFTLYDPNYDDNAIEAARLAWRPPPIVIKRPHLADGGPAFIQWGKTSSWSTNTFLGEDPYIWSVKNMTPPKKPEKPKDPNKPVPEPPPQAGINITHWTEIARQEKLVRVENPVDSEQYVDVKRIESILFQSPNGDLQQFDLNNSGGDSFDPTGGGF